MKATSKQSTKVAKKAGAKLTLLAGGNPQIAKAAGDSPVQTYIAAMPGWKCGSGHRLDALIVGNVPNVRKAVRRNSPFQASRARAGSLGSTYSALSPPSQLTKLQQLL